MKNFIFVVVFVFWGLVSSSAQKLPIQIGWEGSAEMPHGLHLGIPLANNFGLFVSPKTLLFSKNDQWSLAGGIVFNTSSVLPFSQSSLSLGINYSSHKYSEKNTNNGFGLTVMLTVNLPGDDLYLSMGYSGPGTSQSSPHVFDAWTGGIGFNF